MRRSLAPRGCAHHDRRPRPLARRLGLAGAALALLVGLGGCVGIQATATNQPASMGAVRLTSTLCANGAPSCTMKTNGGSMFQFLTDFADDDTKVTSQLLYAVRLPVGPTPSASLTANLAGGGTLGFTRSASYEAELQELEPAPAGERWWGWISAAFDYTRKGKQSLSVGVDVDLPRPDDGGPLPSPIRWRPVVGARIVGDTAPATRPVECGSTNASLYQQLDGNQAPNDTSPTSICIDSPSPDATRGYLQAPIVDFGLLGAKNVASAGGTVGVVFQAKRTGVADPSTTFELAIDGGPPGALISLDKGSVSLGGDAAQVVIATVNVPAGTPAGDYPLTLTGKALNKPVRSAISTLAVKALEGLPLPATPTPVPGGPNGPNGPGADTTPPALSALSLTKGTVKRKNGASSLNLTVSEAAKLTITISRVTKGRRSGSTCSAKAKKGARCEIVKTLKTVKTDGKAGTSTVVLPVKALAKGSYRVAAVATDAAGNSSAASSVTLGVS